MNIFEKELRDAVKQYGGWHNAHVHIDRAYTLEQKYVDYADLNVWDIMTYPLPVKQHTAGVLHDGPAYFDDSLEKRMSRVIEESIALGVKRIDSFIDVTADSVRTRALRIAFDIREKYKDKIDLRLGVYPIFGFKDDDKGRMTIFKVGVEFYAAQNHVDFIGTLPERDALPGHIGFKEHIRTVIEIANHYDNMDVHFQVDQTRDPNENGTETVIEAVRWLRPSKNGFTRKETPTIWLVHSLASSSKTEDRFMKIIDGLKETNIGIIVCPKATLSNKQDRSLLIPAYNSITRVLDFLVEGIQVRIGTDNIEDFFIPTGSIDMYNEIEIASDALRFYNFNTWAKVAAGIKLNEIDKMKIKKAL